MGLSVAAAGTHPLTVGTETESRARRAIALSATRCACSRGESRRWPCTCTSACRPPRTRSGCSTVCAATSRFCSRCRPTLRSGRGATAGLRRPAHLIFQAFPRAGLPPILRRLRRLRRGGRRADRLGGDAAIRASYGGTCGCSRALGTVEVRVMDAQSPIRDVAPLVALIQSLACLELEGEPVIGRAERRGSRREPLPGRARRDGRPADRPGGTVAWFRCERRSTPCSPLAARTRSRWAAPKRSTGCGGWRPQTGPSVSARSSPAARSRPRGRERSLTGSLLRRSRAATGRERSAHLHNPTERSGTCVAGSHTPAPRS